MRLAIRDAIDVICRLSVKKINCTCADHARLTEMRYIEEADTFTDASNVEWTVGDLVELLGNNSRYRVIATRST